MEKTVETRRDIERKANIQKRLVKLQTKQFLLKTKCKSKLGANQRNSKVMQNFEFLIFQVRISHSIIMKIVQLCQCLAQPRKGV